jgi:hypothetical protein
VDAIGGKAEPDRGPRLALVCARQLDGYQFAQAFHARMHAKDDVESGLDDREMLAQLIERFGLRAGGGPGSGNFGHGGRPGHVGGSAPAGRHTAASVMEREKLDPAEVATIKERILKEATTENERKYADELAVAEALIKRGLVGGDTTSKHTNVDGSYTAERLKLHDQVMRQYLEDHAKKHGSMPQTNLQNPVVTFMAGMPGAGKSTSAKDLQKSPNVITIDPDSVKPYLPEYANGLGSTMVARESGDIADKLMVVATKQRMNIVIDGTMKTSGGPPATLGDGAIGKMMAFKEAGYKVEVRFVEVDVNESIQNTVQRFHEQFSSTGKGRYVPTSFSRALADPKHGTKPRASFELAKATDFKGSPLVDAYTHMRGWTGDEKKSNFLIDKRGDLTPGGAGK